MDGKVRENRLRRQADRQGLRLVKSRRRDENAIDFQLYALIEHGGDSCIVMDRLVFTLSTSMTLSAC